MEPIEEQDFQALRSLDFPATKFFMHLSNGTKFFRNKEFEKAISEWEGAAKLRPESVTIRRIPGSVLFRSSLDDVPLVGLLYAVSSNVQTGVAIIRSEYAFKEIFFKEGWVVFARTTKSEERIGNFLTKRGLVSPSNLEKMATKAKKDEVKLGRFLVMKGLLSEKELHELLDFQIKEILCDLFSWKEGEFYFAEKEVEEEDVVVSYTPLDLALLAARRALDFSTFRKMIPHNKVIFRIPPYIERNKAEAMEKLDANEKFIFSLIDGSRNIDQLIKFSGNDEISTINILYRLVLIGLIKKSKDIGTYEDIEFRELSRFLRTFLEVFRLVTDNLNKELGVKSKDVLDKARKGLGEDYRKIFHGVPIDRDVPLDANKILKNISLYYPNPSDRLIFIDGFYEFINNMLHEMSRILGMTLTKRVVSDIEKVRLDIFRFYTDSPVKRKVLEALNKIVAQFPR
ncbi:MAG: DUF4388 domain-containing protein [Deltaproteobacteria bacterium]|nr:DUF4388 domain-containing protein [Deltaproteobacteria bacterium]